MVLKLGFEAQHFEAWVLGRIWMQIVFHLVFFNHVVQFWKESKKQEETVPNCIMFVSLK